MFDQIREYYRGFTFWDWIVIWAVADLGSAGIVGVFTGNPITIWYLLGSVTGWWLHMHNVKEKIQEDSR
jgi:uncharacterized membrane protein